MNQEKQEVNVSEETFKKYRMRVSTQSSMAIADAVIRIAVENMDIIRGFTEEEIENLVRRMVGFSINDFEFPKSDILAYSVITQLDKGPKVLGGSSLKSFSLSVNIPNREVTIFNLEETKDELVAIAALCLSIRRNIIATYSETKQI